MSCSQIEESVGFATELMRELKTQLRRCFIVIVILIAMLVGTNMAWLYMWNQ